MTRTFKTFCARLCGGSCGILVDVVDGKIAGVRGDPDCSFNDGHICPKGRALPELLNHPERLTSPLKRVGEKGSGRWQEISVDEALDTIAGKLQGHIDRSGPESVLLYEGALKGMERHFIRRLARVLGTPNTVSTDDGCHAPRTMAAKYTCGLRAYPDYDHPPKSLMIWGRNSLQNCSDGPPARFRAAFDQGTRFIVIDPRKISLASRAEVWLKPRPGSDGLLALGMLNVIIDEKLYDKDFVDRWTVGFDRLREFVGGYPPSEVAERTWVPEAQIRQAARLYATSKPAAIQWGNALDQTSNAFQACRAIVMLEAITGNLDVPGGGVFPSPLPALSALDFARVAGSPESLKRPVGSRFLLAAEMGIVPGQEASRAILEEVPYPLKAALIFGSNPLLTHASAATTYKALKKLDFLVVAELFLTPTAGLADIVLPVAANLEYDALLKNQNCFVAHPKIVDPPGACLSDAQWISRIAERMGHGECFRDSDSAGPRCHPAANWPHLRRAWGARYLRSGDPVSEIRGRMVPNSLRQSRVVLPAACRPGARSAASLPRAVSDALWIAGTGQSVSAGAYQLQEPGLLPRQPSQYARPAQAFAGTPHRIESRDRGRAGSEPGRHGLHRNSQG